MPDNDNPKSKNLDPQSLARVLKALQEAAGLMPALVRQRAEQVIRLQAQADFEERLESALITRMLDDRARRCPDLEALLKRLTGPTAKPGSPL